MGWGICLNVTSKKRASVFSYVGHYFPIPQNAPSKVKKARETSLGVHWAHVFNLLPQTLEMKTRGTFHFSRITLIYSWEEFLTNQPPLGW